MNINYFQFLNMAPEAMLVVALIITFIADFIAHGKEEKLDESARMRIASPLLCCYYLCR